MSKSVVDQLRDVLGESASTSFEVRHFLDSGFMPLNRIVSGRYRRGLPGGRVIEIFGPSMCGKTAIATLVMASAVEQGGFAMFNDHERSFDINQARSLGLDDASGRFVHVAPDTFEESFVRIINTARKIREEEMIPEDAPIVAVTDSLASMVPASKMSKELDELTMADNMALAKATSSSLPVVKVMAEKLNISVLMLNQLRENPTGYGNPERTSGGKAPAYYADVRIKLVAAALRNKETKEHLGQRVTAECIKTKLTRPFQKTEWDFLFTDDGRGRFDFTGGLIDHLVEIGELETSGSRINYGGKSLYRSQLIEHVEKNKLLPDLQALCRDPE